LFLGHLSFGVRWGLFSLEGKNKMQLGKLDIYWAAPLLEA